MKVETFIELNEIEQVENSESITEYNKRCIDLGLDNLCISEGSDVNGLVPMTRIEREVYGNLCPKKTKLTEYKRVLPKRVLEAYALCKEKGWLEDAKKIIIWESEKDLDPVLIAQFDNYGNDLRMIARWGDELESFPTLLKRAVEAKKRELSEEVARMRSYIELWEKNADEFARSALARQLNGIYFH